MAGSLAEERQIYTFTTCCINIPESGNYSECICKIQVSSSLYITSVQCG